LREEFLTGKTFDSVEDAQAQLDVWVEHYNHQRPHQGIGMVPPFERFRLARAGPATIELEGPRRGTVEISIGEELIRVHRIRHDRTREHGALANPGGRLRRINAA
jgi:hypothetical protein